MPDPPFRFIEGLAPRLTLGLVKCLEISKELIRECAGCCCCMPLLHNHLMDAKIYYSPPKGGAFAPPLPPLNPPLDIVCLCETFLRDEQTVEVPGYSCNRKSISKRAFQGSGRVGIH